MPSSTRLRSMTSARRALPNAERCERPTNAPDSASTDQPGRFAQGPEAKYGRDGLMLGSFMACSLPLDIQKKRGLSRPDGGSGPARKRVGAPAPKDTAAPA